MSAHLEDYALLSDLRTGPLVSRDGIIDCSFWLVEQYAMSGRRHDAEALMDQLVGCANGVGLLSEEYDPEAGRLIGDFPQAFSHLGLIRAADALGGTSRGNRERRR